MAPDPNYFYERLHVGEANQVRMKEEEKPREKPRKKARGYKNSGGGNAYNGNLKPKRKDRSHLKCTYPANPVRLEKISGSNTSLKEIFAANTDNKSINSMGSVTETNLTTFRDARSRADTLGTAPSPVLHANAAGTLPQMRSLRACRDFQGLEGWY